MTGSAIVSFGLEVIATTGAVDTLKKFIPEKYREWGTRAVAVVIAGVLAYTLGGFELVGATFLEAAGVAVASILGHDFSRMIPEKLGIK